MPKAFKSRPKCKKTPNLVTLFISLYQSVPWLCKQIERVTYLIIDCRLTYHILLLLFSKPDEQSSRQSALLDDPAILIVDRLNLGPVRIRKSGNVFDDFVVRQLLDDFEASHSGDLYEETLKVFPILKVFRELVRRAPGAVAVE